MISVLASSSMSDAILGADVDALNPAVEARRQRRVVGMVRPGASEDEGVLVEQHLDSGSLAS